MSKDKGIIEISDEDIADRWELHWINMENHYRRRVVELLRQGYSPNDVSDWFAKIKLGRFSFYLMTKLYPEIGNLVSEKIKNEIDCRLQNATTLKEVEDLMYPPGYDLMTE